MEKDSWIPKQNNEDAVDHVKWRNMDDTHKDRSKQVNVFSATRSPALSQIKGH